MLLGDCIPFDQTAKNLVREYGFERARRILRRMDDMIAALTLEEFRNLPGRCHELLGERKGQLSLDLDGPFRLIFEPSSDPVPLKSDGGLDWNGVTAVHILDVVDTHE